MLFLSKIPGEPSCKQVGDARRLAVRGVNG